MDLKKEAVDDEKHGLPFDLKKQSMDFVYKLCLKNKKRKTGQEDLMIHVKHTLDEKKYLKKMPSDEDDDVPEDDYVSEKKEQQMKE